jgi:hypothetical protein
MKTVTRRGGAQRHSRRRGHGGRRARSGGTPGEPAQPGRHEECAMTKRKERESAGGVVHQKGILAAAWHQRSGTPADGLVRTGQSTAARSGAAGSSNDTRQVRHTEWLGRVVSGWRMS